MEYWGFNIAEGVDGITHRRTYEHALRLPIVAETAGWDGWYFAEHHSAGDYGIVPSPNLLIAAASQRTERLRLGNMVNVLPFNHPYRLAEEIRMLDTLTGGRLELGFGRGGIPTELAAWGVARNETADRFDEALALIRRLLVEGGGDYDGVWGHGQARLAPAPVQTPMPPAWLAAVSDHSIEKAAWLGLDCSSMFLYPELLRARMAEFHEKWAAFQPDRPAGRFGVTVLAAVAETEAEATRFARPHIEERLESFTKTLSAPPAGPESKTYASHRSLFQHVYDNSFEQLVDDGLVVFGSVEQCADQLEAIAGRGVDAVTMFAQYTGLDYDFAISSVELIGDVIGRLERRASDAVAT
jgi:alkanesulfonate monooxygenase SsuD/methylene tetrahydromethanopterin reductase-like flavin-dependent oxidoreductase (luciferase family)